MLRLSPVLVAIAFILLSTTGTPGAEATPSPNLVVSQVYGGGGNAGASFTHDFIELFNRGSSPAALDGMSVQYASATGTGNFGASTTQLTELPSFSLQPGQYFLIQEASTAAVGSPLPTPDVVDATPIAMAAGAGKVALVTGATSLGCNGGSTACDGAALARIVDLVGYGTGTSSANFFEGAAPAPTINATTSDKRAANGCTDTDSNGADFATASPPAPRNSASTLNPCAGDTAPSVLSTTPTAGASNVAAGSNIDVTFSESVTVTDPWFTLVCGGNQQAATFSGGPSTYTIDPAADLPGGSSCTLTINADQVADTDATPPDTMVTDFVTTFSIAALDPCAGTFTPIYSIQGSGLSAAITGNVTTQGVVVGDFEGPTSTSLQGFYLQDAAGDGDPATSDGIFVFTGNADNGVAVGQLLRVTGFARERFNQTSLNGSNSNTSAVPPANIFNCGSGSITPVDVAMPFADAGYPERFEGMLVRLPQSLVIAEYFNYERFGEMVLALPLEGETRPFTGTAIDEPGAPANARTAANSLGRISLDDGLGAQNPPFVRHPNGANFALDNRFRGGDTVTNTVGVLGFDFSLYRIQPTAPAQYASVNPRTAGPEPVGGSLRVAAMNTLNFFLTLDEAGGPNDNVCGGNANLECRGADADQPLEFTRQRDKLLAALDGLDADVIGLNEIENTPGVSPLADIVAGLNALQDPDYAFIDTGVIGTDAIRVGLIYRPSKVQPLGDFETLTSADDPRFIDTKSRPALAQTFEDLNNGGRFTIVVNHLKSKGSDCNDVGDPDAGDGQGNCSGTRTQAALALVDWLATDPTGSGDPDFLIIGDLNSYAKEDPIDAIKLGSDDLPGTPDDFTNLIAAYQGAYAYSYVFDGQSGYLDHALAIGDLVPQVTGAADWHIDSDEPDFLDYDTTFKPPEQDAIYEPNAYRASDHDAVVVGLNLTPTDTDGDGVADVLDNCDKLPNPGQQDTYGDDRGDACDPTGLLPDACAGMPIDAVFIGTNANETINGTPFNDLILAGGGNNTVNAGAGDDCVVTENGNDNVTTEDGNDVILAGGGNNTIAAGGGNNIVRSGAGNDNVTTGDGDDDIDAAGGNNLIVAGDGNDGVTTGNGNDNIDCGPGTDTYTPGGGNNTLAGCETLI